MRSGDMHWFQFAGENMDWWVNECKKVKVLEINIEQGWDMCLPIMYI